MINISFDISDVFLADAYTKVERLKEKLIMFFFFRGYKLHVPIEVIDAAFPEGGRWLITRGDDLL